ncbi:hypothetical protein Cni_G18862 [Canna indica]|uniref:Subtilisin-like protease fibronectin type-III domain-containing protein n=1 Tax=Canna indica TaxID=4628 RepID=A0AAQ3QI42_9LILI|nr:hypothetical protein Cni_G18862 [Canna indica]
MEVSVIARKSVACQSVSSIQEKDLNYPSITVALGGNATLAVVQRTVKNVGEANATYFAVVGAPSGVYVRVYPRALRFTSVNQEMKFSVVFKMMGGGAGAGGASAAEGYLKWISRRREARSPISIIYNNN